MLTHEESVAQINAVAEALYEFERQGSDRERWCDLPDETSSPGMMVKRHYRAKAIAALEAAKGRLAMNNQDLLRELEKVADVLSAANNHFQAEARMNAALHLAENVRPAPLAAAVEGACYNIATLLTALEKEGPSNAD